MMDVRCRSPPTVDDIDDEKIALSPEAPTASDEEDGGPRAALHAGLLANASDRAARPRLVVAAARRASSRARKPRRRTRGLLAMAVAAGAALTIAVALCCAVGRSRARAAARRARMREPSAPWPEPVAYRDASTTSTKTAPEGFRPDGADGDLPGFAQAWAKTSERLCPGGAPDTELRFDLFDWARREVGRSTGVRDWNPAKQLLLSRIFDGTYSGVALSKYRPRESPASATSSAAQLRSIIYMRIWKAGNNQIRFWERDQYERGNLLEHRDVTLGPFWRDDEDNFPRVLERAGYDPADEASRPCIVTAIRDPISHFLSGYNEVMYRVEHGLPMKILLPSLRLRATSTSTDKEELFRLFLDRFLDLEFGHGMGAWWTSGIMLHVFPSSRILPVLRENGVSLTGYLPTLTNLASAWPRFLDDVCPDLPPDFVDADMPTLGQHPSSGDPDGIYRGAKEVWSDGSEYARALCAIHAFDYACWKLPSGVPRICQELFTSDEFVQTFMK